MPFWTRKGTIDDRAPFAALIRAWEPGDILYGLTSERTAVHLGILRRHYPDEASYHDDNGRIRPYSGAHARTVVVIQNHITDTVWNDQVRGGPEDAIRDAMAFDEDGERAVQYANFVKEHDRYNVITGPRPTDPDDPSLKRSWRRTSKAGLEFQLRSGGRVHFLFDAMAETLVKVARKRGMEGNSYTATELRWLYRHRGMAAVKALVHFWNRDGEVPQGAVFGNLAWLLYRPKHTYNTSWEKAPAAARFRWPFPVS